MQCSVISCHIIVLVKHACVPAKCCEDSARTRNTNSNTMTAFILAPALCGLEVEKRYLQRKAKLLAAFLVLQLVLGVLLLLKWAV